MDLLEWNAGGKFTGDSLGKNSAHGEVYSNPTAPWPRYRAIEAGVNLFAALEQNRFIPLD
jgi:hypothetical protein